MNEKETWKDKAATIIVVSAVGLMVIFFIVLTMTGNLSTPPMPSYNSPGQSREVNIQVDEPDLGNPEDLSTSASAAHYRLEPSQIIHDSTLESVGSFVACQNRLLRNDPDLANPSQTCLDGGGTDPADETSERHLSRCEHECQDVPVFELRDCFVACHESDIIVIDLSSFWQ